jgi:hypothetical protein
MTISKFIEGEKIWSRTSKSGRDFVAAAMSLSKRYEAHGFLTETSFSKNGNSLAVLIQGKDQCVRFSQ